MLGVVACVLAMVCKRMQQLPTMLEELCKLIQHCCAMLRRSRNKRNLGSCWLKSLTGFEFCATTCNRVCKRTQHVTSNNVGSCWPTMLRLFAWGLTIHFSAAMKTLVFGNLFKLFRLAITFAREVYLLLGNKDEDKYDNHLIPLIIPNSIYTARANVMVSLKSVNKLPWGFSSQLKNGWLEVVELVALFPFKTGTCHAKNSFRRRYILPG